jgi:hypothetical protein
MNRFAPGAFAFVTALLSPALAHAATTITFTPDHDNTLFDGGNQDLSSGAGQFLFAGISNVGARRALVHFNLSAIPPGATVTSASLMLVDSKSANGTSSLEIHALTAAFGEGTSDSGTGGMGAPATAGDSTWLHRLFPSTLWTAPGGDFAAAVSAVLTVSGPGTYTWTGSGLAVDAQRWVSNPTTNFGWILLDPNNANPESAQRFNSRENSDPTTRPVLTVTFTPPAPPTVPWAGPWSWLGLALGLALIGGLPLGPRAHARDSVHS